MILLSNGCRCSDIKITKNKKGKNQIWRIHYRFYDPTYDKKYFQVFLKGFNDIADLKERATVAKGIIDFELDRLINHGYNPITKSINKDIDFNFEIDPETLFIKALEKAKDKLSIGHRTKIGIKSVIKGVSKAAVQLKLDKIAISKIGRRHLKVILEQCGKNSKRWSNGRFNLYRAYLLMVFKELVELEAITGNPVRDISKKPVTKKLKVVLTDAERKGINEHLSAVDFRFLMFVHLFFHSGGRKTELRLLKPGNIDLVNQKYKCTIMKGKQPIEVERTIKDVAVPYWEFFMKDCPMDHYIFGAFYKPALTPMDIDGPSRHWKKYVKNKPGDGGLGINVDFYSLKHLNTTEMVDALDEAAAADLNKHTSTAMVVKIYDVKQKDRMHNKIKTVNNPFA